MAAPAAAYVGPGAGLSLLGSLWWLLVAVLTAIGIVLYWPIKVLIRWIRFQIQTRTPPKPGSTKTPTVSEGDDDEPSPERDDGADEDADDQRS